MRAFHDLLRPCRVSGTSLPGPGYAASVRREAGETIELFVIDDQSNKHCTLRITLQMSANDPICDGLYYYARQGVPEKVLCLVELKGKNVSHAVDQIMSTYEHLHERFSLPPFQRTKFSWKVHIFVRGAAPIKTSRELREQLERVFGKHQFTITHNNGDLGKLLRGTYRTPD